MTPPNPEASPPAGVADLKRQLRTRLRQALASLTETARSTGAERLRHRLESAPEFQAARSILGFVALPSEPDLLPLLLSHAATAIGTTAEPRAILLPRWDPTLGEYVPARLPTDGRLVPGPFGVPEPPPDAPDHRDEPLDLILVPGLAFDRQGRRLGRGRGFYDRLLARRGRAQRWGVGFDIQLVDEVPAEAHDVNLDLIATPGFWLPVAQAPAGLS